MNPARQWVSFAGFLFGVEPKGSPLWGFLFQDESDPFGVGSLGFLGEVPWHEAESAGAAFGGPIDLATRCPAEMSAPIYFLWELAAKATTNTAQTEKRSHTKPITLWAVRKPRCEAPRDWRS